ncbi:hypothetical protein [Caldinitratiruptor microaerophilus]|uniref:hypothetical protein n=1 Tax=Caldinitratiruptor microaerophilus TaxID=671077 RepID=UPI00222ED8EE|nr:hypothetical protein [Caldinitratiruptor microaerophilus]
MGWSGGGGARRDRPADRIARHRQYILASQRPTGAIALTPARLDINPYFANRAARALLADRSGRAAVRRYMNWYVRHLNPDGTIDDFTVRHGMEVSRGTRDSSDAYAATFLSLVAAYLDAGGDVRWVRAHLDDLRRVAGAIESLTDRDGLTWARADYPVKFLMDNVEVWRGWFDWARVLEAAGEREEAAAARERAARVESALGRFARGDGRLDWGLGPYGTRWRSEGRFYPDGVVQFFPLVHGLTDDPAGYHAFAAAHPAWHRLEEDAFPWVLAAVAAARAGDRPRAAAALAEVEERFAGLEYPWHVGESAAYIEAAELLARRSPAGPEA